MARALSNGKVLFAALSDGLVLSGRRFSSAAAAAGRVMMEETTVLRKGVMKTGTATGDEAAMSWIPDPVTGYYRPANCLRETDPAELRQIFLKNKAYV
ncbi:hypothetical protein KFK09_014997 [Dendrobium nobile]|uniref:Late embryogenesis abundant protein Lea5 n=1 Tax=Dendrobium nobile TaxID=94219 RepID=A0A8T3B3K8_DENNO|nr:hypothetical protein KFK09_014996 [Dendrobium nobile]KAI0504050.1 hypothetical protein KFK09_014997 [Dendrobium nobile]